MSKILECGKSFFQVDTINSVQFSNHTGYSAGVRGQILDDSQLQELIDGLDANNINKYSHIINGYIGSKYTRLFNFKCPPTDLLFAGAS